MVKHTVFISLLFTITVQALESTENNWSSASQAGDQLSQFEQKLQQALERIASLEEENDYLAERWLTSTDEKRELERENKKFKNELQLESSGNKFHSKLVPIAYVVGGITATLCNQAKNNIHQIDSKILEALGKIFTNPQFARAVALHYPALYGWQTTCCNDSISIHINPIDLLWTSGESFYNKHYYHMKTPKGSEGQQILTVSNKALDQLKGNSLATNLHNTLNAEISAHQSTVAKNRLSCTEVLQLTACELAKRIARSVHITLKNDPIAPIPGTTYTLITTDQLVRSVLKTAADETEHFVMHRIQGTQTKPDHISHFAKNLAKQMSAEAAYNIIAQTAHGITRDSDYNYHVAKIFPSDLQERTTFVQSWTKFVIKWLLINGTPYVYQKLHPQPST